MSCETNRTLFWQYSEQYTEVPLWFFVNAMKPGKHFMGTIDQLLEKFWNIAIKKRIEDIDILNVTFRGVEISLSEQEELKRRWSDKFHFYGM